MAPEDYLARWRLAPDGEPFTTRGGLLWRVRRIGGAPAMLKVALEAEEARGGVLMAWWGGEGAARVLEREGDALLLERATGPGSLSEMARGGRDDEAGQIICGVAARLHAPRGQAPRGLVPLGEWFRELWPAADAHRGVLGRCAEAARALLASPRDTMPLHGDLHHDNVLDAGERGWLAIDPKGLVGERGFDFANIFCNPGPDVALSPGRFARQAAVVAQAARLERRRLLQWALAYAGLSAAWSMGEGDDDEAELPLEVAEIAAAELARALEQFRGGPGTGACCVFSPRLARAGLAHKASPAPVPGPPRNRPRVAPP